MKLYPPYIEGIIPSFSLKSGTGTVITVPFSMNRAVGQAVVSNFSLKVKNIISNEYILTLTADSYNYERNEVYFVLLPTQAAVFNIGQHYKIQLAYIDITGDYSILEEKVPYVVGEQLSDYEHEKGLTFNYSEEEATLLEHCIKSLKLSMNSLGRHKLPLMGGGDWNDGMNRVGIKGKGESVWLGFFLYNVIDLFAKMMKTYDKKFYSYGTDKARV